MKNSRRPEASEEEPSTSAILYAPLPNLSEARLLKEDYRNYPIDRTNERYNESLVDISTLNLAGQAYYSRPNAVTTDPVPEVPKKLFLRQSVAEKLVAINEKLNNPHISLFFGGHVELYIEDAYRLPELQGKLHRDIFPHLIWKQHPEMSDEQRESRLQELISEPSNDPLGPPPHLTGGAVDVILRYRQATLDYVKGSEVYMGHVDGDTSKKVYLDYFEVHQLKNDQDRLAWGNRRAFYSIMTGKAFGIDTELQVNPTEFWHWSYGDQMWAKLCNEPAAMYGLAKP